MPHTMLVAGGAWRVPRAVPPCSCCHAAGHPMHSLGPHWRRLPALLGAISAAWCVPLAAPTCFCCLHSKASMCVIQRLACLWLMCIEPHACQLACQHGAAMVKPTAVRFAACVAPTVLCHAGLCSLPYWAQHALNPTAFRACSCEVETRRLCTHLMRLEGRNACRVFDVTVNSMPSTCVGMLAAQYNTVRFYQ